MTNKKAGQALTGRPAIESGKSFFSFSCLNSSKSNDISQIIDWSRLGFCKNSRSLFDYERGKNLIYAWNLSSNQYDTAIKCLVDFLGV